MHGLGSSALVINPLAAHAGALAATLLALILLAYLLYAKLPPVLPSRQAMGFLDHATELRNRLIRVFGLLGFWIVLLLTFRFQPLPLGPLTLAYPVPGVYDNAASRIYLFLANLNVPPGTQLIVTNPTEAVAAQLEVALLLGLLLTFPVLAYEAWAFFGPGLRARERRFLARIFPVSFLLFLAGAAFGLALMGPLLFRVLYAFARPLGAVQFLSAGSLVGTLTTMALIFGLAFQLPLVMVALVRFGLVAPTLWLRYWRHATLLIFLVAAIVTDPTLLSQMIVGIVLLGLYWGGVAASFLARPSPAPHPQAQPART